MHRQPLSEEKLNAYVDQQLASDDRTEVIRLIREDPSLAQKVNDLQELKEWVNMAYQEPPGLHTQQYFTPKSLSFNQIRALAASLLLLFGGLLGWWLHEPELPGKIPSFHELTEAETAVESNDKLLIHISKMDSARINMALDKAEHILKRGQQQGKPLQVEIVANAQGLALLRDKSPFGQRIAHIASHYDNITFLACGIAMQNVRLSEGVEEVKLLPQAQQIDAALEQILRRLKAGWAYVRG